jgi:regulatory protein
LPESAFKPDADEAEERPALTDALASCYAHLARHEHSVAELRSRLERAGFDGATVEEALATVIEQGYLSDERYARLLAEDRRTLDGWGVERIRERMLRVGIDPAVIAMTLAPFDAASELDAALTMLKRRLPAAPTNARERQRAFALLVRQGFASEIAYDAVRAHGGAHHGGDDELELAS